MALAKGPRLPAVAYAASLLGPVALLVTMGWHRRWACDDAYIDFRVVENLFRGNGPVFNVGERVEAYTNPLWVGLLLAWRSLGLELAIGSVLLGLVFSVVGLVAGIAAAQPIDGKGGASVPVGALLIACLPSMWDFATSGLETGLAFAWLGLSYWAIGWNARGGTTRWRTGAAFLAGLGPLIRPDLLLFASAFAFLLMVPRPRLWRLLSVWALPSVAYQIFRMGYFGAVISNSAIAKEPLAHNWVQGWRYLRDFVSGWPHFLALAATLFLLTQVVSRAPSAVSRIAVCAVPVAALLQALFIMRLGGDFMHARLLLPPLFGLLLPVFAVPLPAFQQREAATWIAVAAVGLGALASARIKPQEALVSEDGIADERAYYVWWAGTANPVTVSDYEKTPFVAQGKELRLLAELAPHSRRGG